MSVVITGLQNRVKNSAAYAQEIGLMLIANGEEPPYLLSQNGEQIPAGIQPPTFIPTVADGGSGTLTNGDWVVYMFVYVMENIFPLVAAVIYSNPSPESAPYQIAGSGTRQNTVTVKYSSSSLVTSIYIYRTGLQTTEELAKLAADAGNLNFIGKVANVAGTGTTTFTDNLLTATGNDVLQFINFVAPQFRFVVWDGSYFWGWANQPFNAVASWTTGGIVTLQNPATDQFYGGRNGQFITFSNITSGGIDGRGTYIFSQTGQFTGQVQDEEGNNLTLPTTATGNIVIIGQSATLYRSGHRNPFQWGYEYNIAGAYVPTLWALKVGGSIGTAISIVPAQQLLKLDMEYPALCVTYSLQTSDTDAFAQTQRQVSNLYSITSHFSQFPAVFQGRQVLWGFDYKNLAVLMCDGYTQTPISGPISILLRSLTKNRSLQLLCHGLYDPVTECNLIWLSSAAADQSNPVAMFDLCIYQHAPTGYWGILYDYGILCSAPVEDPNTSLRSIIVGTENGFVGKAFDTTTYGNWLPIDSLVSGFINSATSNSITRSEGQDDFNPLDSGLIGNFCLITNSAGLDTQVVKITGATSDTLIFEQVLNPIPSTSVDTGLITGQWLFFIGLIELRMLKYFDGGEPSVDKAPREYWATITDAQLPTVEFFPEHAQQASQSLTLNNDSDLDAWFNKINFPTKKGKTFGIALVERSYEATRVYNFTLT
jgi:hypothetical protein